MSTYKKKLIEVALPLATINRESAQQKTMGAAAHPQNLHRWWARRPLAAARAVLWASLVDDPSAHPDRFPTEEDQARERRRLFDVLERLVPWEANNDEAILEEARAEIIASCDGDLPNVLDPFAGGGAIPLEALRLGLPTFAGDLNPVAVLIQRAMLEIPQRFSNQPPVNPADERAINVWSSAAGLASDVLHYGKWMRDRAFEKIGDLYPSTTAPDGSSATPIAWIWARTVASPDPAWPGRVPLVRSWALSKKPNRPTTWVEPLIDESEKTISYRIRSGGTPPRGTVTSGRATCLATGSAIALRDVDEAASRGQLGATLMAVVAQSDTGRHYVEPGPEQALALNRVPERDALDASRLVPHGKARGTFAGNAQGRYYGFHDFSDYFSDRQLTALSTFSGLLAEVRREIENDALNVMPLGEPLRDGGNGARAYAEAIVTYLAFVIDRCADVWSQMCTWHVNNEQVTATFARQAIAMSWDFAEANPFSDRMASWMSMLKTCARAIPTVAVGSGLEGRTAQVDAAARIRSMGTVVVATDPPYYDNISYADSSDFFYVWARMNLRDIWPDECATLLTPKAEELIADKYRAGSTEAAEEHFEHGMAAVFSAAEQHADPRFPATIFYAFKATETSDGLTTSTGWDTFLSGLMTAGWTIVGTWPMRTELTTGLKARAAMLASSVVLVCRPRSGSAAMATRSEFISALKAELPPAIKLLQAENIAPVDMAQSAIGPGIGIYSRYTRVVEADGSDMTVRTALALINEVLSEVLSGDEAELDSESRFAVTWFEQYGQNPGPVGDAITLATAKNTSIDGVVEAGIAASRDGKFRLLERFELDPDWNPQTDTRLTVWETTQHLIHRLEHSETDAAGLLTQVGPGYAERARQLAYLLYGICDRKKWAEEAAAYNTLVTAWPELSRLAVAGDGPGQGQLI